MSTVERGIFPFVDAAESFYLLLTSHALFSSIGRVVL